MLLVLSVTIVNIDTIIDNKKKPTHLFASTLLIGFK